MDASFRESVSVLGKILVCVWVLVALGCSETIDVPVEQGPEDDTLRPTLGLDESIADLALSAVVLWQDATGGRYQPDTHLGCDGTETFCVREERGMMTECLGPDDSGTFNGCCDSVRHEIRLSEDVAMDQKISTLAHEFGHSLDLEHAATGLMNPARGKAERHVNCIDQVTLDAFAERYDAEPGSLTVTCYEDGIRSEMLSLLDGLR